LRFYQASEPKQLEEKAQPPWHDWNNWESPNNFISTEHKCY